MLSDYQLPEQDYIVIEKSDFREMWREISTIASMLNMKVFPYELKTLCENLMKVADKDYVVLPLEEKEATEAAEYYHYLRNKKPAHLRLVG